MNRNIAAEFNQVSKNSPFPKVKVAIALLCYNNKDLLERFLPGLLTTIPKSKDYGLFVIDNASSDDTQDYLAQFKDQLHVITIEVNKGFTNGYARGLAQINADIFCLLSSDVEVSPGWIEPVVAQFEQDAKVAVVQPKIKSWHEKSHFEYAGASGGFIDALSFPFCRGRIFYDVEEDHGQYNEPMEIFWASGACFFIRAHVYEESGGLDNDFYAHMEEIDLCWRLKNRGYKIMVCPQSEVYHIGGAVIAYGSPEKTYRNHRNNLIMMVKNLPPSELFWKVFLRLLLDALAFWNMVLRGQVRASFAIIHAHWNFLWNLPRWLRKRQKLQSYCVKNCNDAVYPRSIIWDYFARGKRTFASLNWKP